MNKVQIRSDGPPEHDLIGSFDGFQTEFSVKAVLNTLGETKCLAYSRTIRTIKELPKELKEGAERIANERPMPQQFPMSKELFDACVEAGFVQRICQVPAWWTCIAGKRNVCPSYGSW